VCRKQELCVKKRSGNSVRVECVLIALTKTYEDNVEALAGEMLTHSPRQHEMWGRAAG
jgi:hypothetical protein